MAAIRLPRILSVLLNEFLVFFLDNVKVHKDFRAFFVCCLSLDRFNNAHFQHLIVTKNLVNLFLDINVKYCGSMLKTIIGSISMEKSNINYHIYDYLKNDYLKQGDNYESTVMIRGTWGVGKTHFINEAFGDDEFEDYLVLKISLFGLVSIDELNANIIKKYVAVKGQKFGENLKENAYIGKTFDKLNEWKNKYGGVTKKLQEKFFSSIGNLGIQEINPDDRVFIILDDMERTNIKDKELFGLIHKLVLDEKYRVLLIANEKEIIDDECFKNYGRYKEKVIGKTFELKHINEDVLRRFIDNVDDENTKRYLEEYVDQILEVYEKASYHNLRHLSFAVRDFTLLYKKIEKILTDRKLEKIIGPELVLIYFMLYIENMHEPINLKEFLYNRDKKKSIQTKYNHNHIDNLIFNICVWTDIIQNNIINLKEIEKAVEDSIYFEVNAETVAWKALLDFRSIDEDKFQSTFDQVVEELSNGEINNAKIFLHMLGTFLLLSEWDVYKKSKEDIQNEFIGFLDKTDFKIEEIDKDLDISDAAFGVVYSMQETECFAEIKRLVVKKLIDASDEIIKGYADEFSTALKEQKIDEIEKMLTDNQNQRYVNWPIFKFINADEFYTDIQNIPNQRKYRFFKLLTERIEMKGDVMELRSEKDFWINLEQKIGVQKENSISALALEHFKKYKLVSINEKLQ